MTLTDKAKEVIQVNMSVIGELMTVFNKSHITINRWVRNDDVRLSTPEALKIIKTRTGLSENEIFQK